MKNCIYLIKDTTNGKYYVGSHKDADNVESKAYLGSGDAIQEAVAQKGAEAFNSTVLKRFEYRYSAFQAEKSLLEALDAANDEMSYNKTNEVFGKKPNWFTRTFFLPKNPVGDGELQGWIDLAKTKDQKESNDDTNDFRFESGLGLFLERGFDAFAEEGERPGYDDPTKKNWEKQVQLLKVQLGNNVSRELFIKENKYSMLNEALTHTDELVVDQIEFVMQRKRAENEMHYILEQQELIAQEKGWYLMLHEALHDGFQDGSKKRMTEVNEKYNLS